MTDHNRDPHARPPQAMRDVYKRIQRAKAPNVEDEFAHEAARHREDAPLHVQDDANSASPRRAFESFTGSPSEAPDHMPHPETSEVPGLLVYRSLLPPDVQLLLLDKVFHRDLSNPEHLTNVHLHYDVPYPGKGASYFDPSAKDLRFEPQDPAVHKPFNIETCLNKKLRWMTLGGQYDWTNKVYPSSSPPPFPADMAKLVGDLFGMTPEAAIVNLYSPGDTLSLHRDLSEECNRPLVSISLGCDGIFLIGLEGDVEGNSEPRMATLRLRSGDAVVMAGESRYAWHGIPKVLGSTCPSWMADWPCVDGREEKEKCQDWKGWTKGKRINLNVRQMFA